MLTGKEKVRWFAENFALEPGTIRHVQETAIPELEAELKSMESINVDGCLDEFISEKQELLQAYNGRLEENEIMPARTKRAEG